VSTLIAPSEQRGGTSVVIPFLPMRIPPQVICNLEHTDRFRYKGERVVQNADLRSVYCKVEWSDAFTMACRNEIEAICTPSGNIKYFRLLNASERPEEQPKPETPPKGARGAVMQPALCAFYVDADGPVRIPSLSKARGGISADRAGTATETCGLVRWSDRDGFNPNRFNPDRIPRPLMAATSFIRDCR
jgi:hypothetical protein